MVENEALKELFARYLTGAYTRQDVDSLLMYFGSAASEQELRSLIEKSLQQEIDLSGIDQEIKKVDHTAFATLRQYTTPRQIHYWDFVRIAASIIMLIGCGWGIYQYMHKTSTDTISPEVVIAQDIAPGTHRALLSFSDGREFVLDGNGIINHEGQVSYRDGERVVSIGGPRQLTLKTPLAAQYQATLPDGTQVWLNAGSEITYPSAFESKVRQVSMKGEVYFEVAKDATRPFIVESDRQRVEVLGTHFNINAYKDNGLISTTLSEGSVRVVQQATGKEAILRQGQQSLNPETGTLTVSNVDLDQVLSWKEGMYILKNQEMGLFGKQIARWYDVEVDMGGYERQRLSAIIPRSSNLSSLLEAITLETGIHFKVEGRRVKAIQN